VCSVRAIMPDSRSQGDDKNNNNNVNNDNDNDNFSNSHHGSSCRHITNNILDSMNHDNPC
jgi:hypothetical protein